MSLTEELFRQQEMMRARHVIDKAILEDKDVGEELRRHFVWPSIAQELIGEVPEYKPKPKKIVPEEIILEWASSHVGETTNGTEISAALCDEYGITYAQANKVIQARGDWFRRVKKGAYIVHDAVAERAEAK